MPFYTNFLPQKPTMPIDTAICAITTSGAQSLNNNKNVINNSSPYHAYAYFPNFY